MRTLFHSEYEVLSRRASLVVFAFVAFCFLVLAVRTELADNRIEHNALQIRLAQWQACVASQGVVDRFNMQQKELADIERSQQLAPEIAKRRIAVYEEGVLPALPPCGPQPK